MAVRAFIAAIMALAALLAGALYTLSVKDAGLADVLALLWPPGEGPLLLCTFAAWGSIAAAALAVIAAHAAFNQDPDDPYRRRISKAVPVSLIIASLVLFWAMFDCAARQLVQAPEAPVVETAVAPMAPEPEPALAGAPQPPQAEPTFRVDPAVYSWPYMIPLIRDDGYAETAALDAALRSVFPLADETGRVRSALCGAAWVMVSGATSEEGPRARNLKRSRIRAALGAAAAEDWLDAHADDCLRPVVLALDLGQHAPGASPAIGDGSDTSFQRAVIVVSRLRRTPDEALSLEAALAEAEAALAEPAMMEEIAAGRTYVFPPAVFAPHSAY